LGIGATLKAITYAVKGSAQFCSGMVEKWRTRQDENGHSYVIAASIDF
jgi:hypothetical protein